jgi:hypothetical protein
MKTGRIDPVRFSDDEREAIGKAAVAVWQAIGGDILSAAAEESELTPLQALQLVTLSRREVIEVCLDADRLQDQLRTIRNFDGRRGRASVVTDDLLQRVTDCGYAQLIQVVMPHFPFQCYGF